MKKLFLYVFVIIMVFPALRVFAQTTSNSDFDPFPQMEQDQKGVDDDTAAKPDQENDGWPPANSNAQTNSDGEHD